MQDTQNTHHSFGNKLLLTVVRCNFLIVYVPGLLMEILEYYTKLY